MSTLIGSLIDAIVQNPDSCGLHPLIGKSDRKRHGGLLLEQLIKSHRFHLSSRTTEVSSRLGFEANDKNMLVSLARPPFNNMWLEWDLKSQFDGMSLVTADDAPERIGMLITQLPTGPYQLTTVTHLHDRYGHQVFVSPVSIVFDPNNELDRTPWKRDRELIATCLQLSGTVNLERMELDHISNIMDGCLVGGATTMNGSPIPINDITNIANAFIRHATHVITPIYGKQYFPDNQDSTAVMKRKTVKMIIAENVLEGAGALRFVIGALALINSKEYVTRQTVKPTNKNRPPESLKENKRSPVYDFVDFIAPHKVYIRDIIESQTTDHEPKHVRPLHEVMGHFAHSRTVGDIDCQHQYEKRGENSWVCLQCTKKRWFRKEHTRGDPEVGVVKSKARIVKM